MSAFFCDNCMKNSRQAPQGIPLPPPLGALSLKAIMRFTAVYIHIKCRRPLGAQIHHAAAAFKANPV